MEDMLRKFLSELEGVRAGSVEARAICNKWAGRDDMTAFESDRDAFYDECREIFRHDAFQPYTWKLALFRVAISRAVRRVSTEQNTALLSNPNYGLF